MIRSIARRQTRQIQVGPVAIGGGAPISVQSMTTTKTADVDGTLSQVYALAAAGADIVQIDEPYLQARAEKARRFALPAINRALEG